jgi:hypothetical protein
MVGKKLRFRLGTICTRVPDKPVKRILVFTALSLLTAMICSYYWHVHSMPYYLSIVAKSSTDSNAQVFYDIGNGFQEEDSAKTIVKKSSDFGQLSFQIPAGPINGLRFDPLDCEGTLEIKQITIEGAEGVVHKLDHRKVLKPVNEMSLQNSENRTVLAHAPAGSTDPIISIALSEPLDDWNILNFFDEDWLQQALFLFVLIAPIVLALAFQHPSQRKSSNDD